ncbi:endonuclease domain-containing 1 protein-like [Scyliorhinus canicula]|uniref:endonuclease domain-containing 1 protein-like n=1 Tax=Scyliorhinus canicula TaxID=7830 RepID=UPI0018F501D8|nr:endonuclease domain-containing 1 protein-like [Scyliorhinus canicula]
MGRGRSFLLLLLTLLHPGTVPGEVVRDFQTCNWFFQNMVPPQGFPNRGRVKICQRYKNHYHYATLYRTDHRIPVYSAYRYPCSLGSSDGYRPSPWFQEPQIDDQNAATTMGSRSTYVSERQAVDKDYQDSGYNRGHLYPFALNEWESATSTCTLTNAVPEDHAANVNWYQEAESIVQKLARICRKSDRSMYLVTGAANPSGTKINNRVSVPGLVWTALCCTFPRDQNNDPCQDGIMKPEGQDVLRYNRDFSFAFMKAMKPEKATVHLSVRQLARKLKVAKLFDKCRGASESDEMQILKEVEGLIQNKIINPVNTASSPLRPLGYEAAVGIFQLVYSELLDPGQAVVQAVSSSLTEVARVSGPVFLGFVTVIGVLAVNVLAVLLNHAG